MKCKTCKKLVHQLMDGELDQNKKSDVCKHLRECEDCQAYHHQLVRMCAALRDPDTAPPEGFRESWKASVRQTLTQEQKPRKRFRPTVLIPAVTACAAAVFLVSTAIVNPQALGLSGNNLTGEWFAVDRTAVQATPTPSSIPEDGVDVEFYSKKEVKPNLLDYASSNYSETITAASTEPELESAGEIVSSRAPADETALSSAPPEANAGPEESHSVYEIGRSQIDPWSNFAMVALTSTEVTVTQHEDFWLLTGDPERVVQMLASYGASVPEGTSEVRILLIEHN